MLQQPEMLSALYRPSGTTDQQLLRDGDFLILGDGQGCAPCLKKKTMA
jgi:hypothetical protein